MYESLLKWCNFSINIHKRTAFSPSGDITGEVVTAMGYRVDEIKHIINKNGDKYISTSHVYFPPEVSIRIVDKISFPDDKAVYEVQKISGFFEGNTGKKSITVVYL